MLIPVRTSRSSNEKEARSDKSARKTTHGDTSKKPSRGRNRDSDARDSGSDHEPTKDHRESRRSSSRAEARDSRRDDEKDERHRSHGKARGNDKDRGKNPDDREDEPLHRQRDKARRDEPAERRRDRSEHRRDQDRADDGRVSPTQEVQKSAQSHGRQQAEVAEEPVSPSPHRDTNRASSSRLATPSAPPPERPVTMDYGDDPPAQPASTQPTDAPLVPDYLPAPEPAASVTQEDFDRAFPGLDGLAPCDAVERLRATLRLRGVIVSEAGPDLVRPGPEALAMAHTGRLHLVTSRDTNKARRKEPSAGRSSAARSHREKDAGHGGRDDDGHDNRRESRHERDTGKARGNHLEREEHSDRDDQRPATRHRHDGRDTGHDDDQRDTGRHRNHRAGRDDHRDRRHQDEPPPDRDLNDGPPLRHAPPPSRVAVLPAQSPHIYKIPSEVIVTRIRDLQPACTDQRLAERSERDTAALPSAVTVTEPNPAVAVSRPAPETRAVVPAEAPVTSLRTTTDAPGAVYQSGSASWYGRLFHGRRTASGERYDMFKYTAAHLKLPLGTYIRVWRHDHRNSVVVKVNDRGPYHGGRIIDLSYAAAQALGFSNAGTGQVEIELLDRRTGNTTLVREEAVFTSRRLEAGAFTDPADAEVRRQTLLEAGFTDAQVVPIPTAELFAVRVGPYTSEQLLEAARRRIERLGLIVEAVPD